MGSAAVLVLSALLLVPVATAAAELPPSESGVSVYVPLSSSSGIVIDGDLSDWADTPVMSIDNSLLPGSDTPGTSNVEWQVAADGLELYLAATIDDETIVAGQHGDDYWNEDSIEFYVNLSDDQETTTYGPGIAQITVSPIDIGNSDPDVLTISGNNSADVVVRGYVFATRDGWGAEIALDLAGLTVPSHLQTFGLQVQVNGSSGGDRDAKLSWSVADVEDTSFNDPSVFGTAIFYDESIGGDRVVDAAPGIDGSGIGDNIADEETTQPADEETTQPVESAEPPPSQPEQGRTLLIAAVLSAASIMGGGLWFERRRKASEERQRAIGTAPDHRPQDPPS